LFFLFLLLEVSAIFMLVQRNNFHRARFINVTSSIQGFLSENLGGFREYLALRQINSELSMENTLLRNRLDELERQHQEPPVTRIDSIPGRMYSYIPARVINNSTNKQFNFITLNKGRNHGIEPEMAVISGEGVIGVVYEVSANYSTVIPLINRDFRLSAKIRRTDYFGSLSWPGRDYREAILEEIPFHVEIRHSDTIVTSGYSAIFPEGILVGTVKDFEVREGNFYTITVDISVDYKNLSHVNVVQNLLRDELLELERISGND
jgi:rod shape-determining protein MreC